MQAETKKAKLVYVSSSSHSGSTLTDMLIGALDNVFSTGELLHFTRQMRASHITANADGSLCTCLNPFDFCPVWTKVVELIDNRVGSDIFAKPESFNLDLLHSRRSGLWGKLQPRGVFGHMIQYDMYRPLEYLWSAVYRQAVQNNWLLLDAIAEITGCEYIVDSSKSCRRLKLMHDLGHRDISVIIVMRDIRGVAASAMTRGKSIDKVARGWVRHYNRMWRVLGRMKDVKFMTVQYADLCCDTTGVLNRIADFLGVEHITQLSHINTHDYHLVGGNPMRHKGLMEVRYDEKWRSSLNADQLNVLAETAKYLHSGWAELGLKPMVD